MKYARRFLISLVAGAGSAIGAFIGKECMLMVKNEYEQNKRKKEAEVIKSTISKEEES